MLHVFIDTNIFLNFFHYTNDVIDELQKLVALIKKNKVELYLTDQVCDEFDRNRESKIDLSISDFNKMNLPGLPRLMAEYPGAEEYQKLSKEIKKLQNSFMNKTKLDAFSEDFAADKLFHSLKNVSKPIQSDKKDIQRARERTEKNSPPGKNGSLGDRLNWELLIAYVPAELDIHIISKDGDFSSRIDAKKPHPVLVKEWKKKNKADLFLYTDLTSFTSAHFPEIKIATDLEKREAIDRLKGSSSFASTHSSIAGIANFSDIITADEVDELVEAALANPQISWIGTDEDVSGFYGNILTKRLVSYDQEKQDLLKQMFGLEKDK